MPMKKISDGQTYIKFKTYLQENKTSKKKEVPNYKFLDV